MKKKYTFKKKKQNRKLIMVPLVMLISVIAVVIFAIIIKNKASALTSNLEITTKYKCGSDSSHTVAITKDYVELSSSMHAKKIYCQDCSYTTYVESEKHDSASEGHQPNSCMDPYIRCTKCGYKIEKASDATIESLHQYLNVSNNWVSISDTQHEQQYTCTVCHVTVSKNKGSHDSNAAPNSCMNPYYLCSKCGKQMKKASDTEIEALHNYVNGVCTVCQKQQTTHTHTWGYYPQGNTGSHTKACTGCSSVTTETCSPKSSKIISAATCVDAAVVELTCSQCGGTWQTTGAAATGNHKYVNGVCSVCGAKDPSYTETCTHPSSSRTNTYQKSDTNQHKVTVTCTECNTVLSTTYEEHSGSTHSNFGYCTKCGELYDPHGSDNRNLKRYETSESGHIKVYPCTGKDCSVEFKSTIEAHTFENGICSVCDYECIHSWNGTRTCTNDVKCTKCGKILLAYGHDYPSTPSRYTKDSSKHTPIYVCSTCGNEKTGAASNHTGGTHNNGGKCTVCSQIYQTHSKGTIIDSYNKTTTAHTPLYKCTYSGCTEKYTGTASNHTGGTHSNGGKCTVCNQVYQTHSKGTIIDSYNKTTTGHTPLYKCSYSGCTEKYAGTFTNHNVPKSNWTDNKNATHSGTCTICNYKVTASHTYSNGICTMCGAKESSDSPTCTHNYAIKSNEISHWEQCTICDSVKANSIKDHNVSTWNDIGNGKHSGNCTVCQYTVSANHTFVNGECTVCKAKESTTPEECNHNYVIQKDENSHWEKCTICQNETIKSAHDITKWTDMGDGKHKGICTVCNYEVIRAHTYSNGECTACKAKQSTTPENCTHNYEIKSDETSHWEQCTICQKETAKSAHNITTWTDKKDGNHEGTCTVCKKVITEAHTNGASGKCTKCSYDGTSSGNNSGNGNNNNSNNGNNNNGGNNSSSGNNSGTNGKDNTTANGKIPQTGITPIFITTIIATVGIAGFAVYKMKKLKDVK